MAIKEKALAQIDSALAEYDRLRPTARFDDLSDLGDVVYQELDTILGATIERLAPADSKYRETLQYRANHKVGALKALRRDYEAGYLESVQQLVRAEVFFHQLAQHLIDDPPIIRISRSCQHGINVDPRQAINAQVSYLPESACSFRSKAPRSPPRARRTRQRRVRAAPTWFPKDGPAADKRPDGMTTNSMTTNN